MKTKLFNFRIPEALLHQIETACKFLKMSKSDFVRFAIVSYLSQLGMVRDNEGNTQPAQKLD